MRERESAAVGHQPASCIVAMEIPTTVTGCSQLLTEKNALLPHLLQ
eukprot:SAG22_NODE_21705_length_254_cov_1.677419_1_plen_45_part_10